MNMENRPLASPDLEAKLREFWQLDNDVLTLTEQLSQLKARRKDVGENELTTLARDEGVNKSGVRLSDGREVRFEMDLSCGIKKEDRATAHQWITTAGAGNLLKRYLVLSFGRDSFDLAARVRNMVARLLPQYDIKLVVGDDPDLLPAALTKLLEAADLAPMVTVTEETELPGATLAKFVRQALAKGTNLPAFLNVYAPLKPILVLPPPPADAAEQEARLDEQLKGSLK
jgi:hypothetical protein